MLRKPHELNVALSLVVALRAYCPRVKITDPEIFKRDQMVNKRRTRPLIGRGNYGKNLMAHFDSKNNNVELRRQKHAAYLAHMEARRTGMSAAY